MSWFEWKLFNPKEEMQAAEDEDRQDSVSVENKFALFFSIFLFVFFSSQTWNSIGNFRFIFRLMQQNSLALRLFFSNVNFFILYEIYWIWNHRRDFRLSMFTLSKFWLRPYIRLWLCPLSNFVDDVSTNLKWHKIFLTMNIWFNKFETF